MAHLASAVDVVSARLDELRARMGGLFHDPADDRSVVVKDVLDELASAVEALSLCGEELVEQAEQLHRSEERYADLFYRGPDGFLVTDPVGVICEANRQAGALLGWPVAHLIGKPLMVFLDAGDRAELRRATRALLRSGDGVGVEVRLRRRGGETFDASLHGICVPGSAGDGVHWTLRDETERKTLQDQLTYRANHDSLTGVASRAYFLGHVDRALRRSWRPGRGVGVLFVDLDRFKAVNDRLGHPAGDELLRHVADRLRSRVRRDHLVGRLGGDEFAIACPGVSPAEIRQLGERVLAELATEFTLSTGPIRIGATVGIALAGQRHISAALDGADGPAGLATAAAPVENKGAEALIRDADLAMYVAKKSGRNRYAIFGGELRDHSLARIESEVSLRRAIDSNELRLYYQPQFDLHDGRLVGLEALLRWQRSGVGLLSAADFITLAEEADLIGEIDRWVVAQACRDLRRWRAELDLADIEVAVNVFPGELMNCGFIELLQAELQGDDQIGTQLCVEITERGEVLDLEELAGPLRQLRPLGIKVALDDFGTGHSSLGYLRRLPIDSLKIDRAFVAGLPHSREDELIVAAVVDLANELGLNTVAEGVERAEQVETLRELGCRVGQGYLLADPCSAEDVRQVLTRRQPAGAPPAVFA